MKTPMDICRDELMRHGIKCGEVDMCCLWCNNPDFIFTTWDAEIMDAHQLYQHREKYLETCGPERRAEIERLGL